MVRAIRVLIEYCILNEVLMKVLEGQTRSY
jgi:hypothetical protein